MEQTAIKHLDKPAQPVNFSLIKNIRGPNGFEAIEKFEIMDIDNGLPTMICPWVTTHPPCRNNLFRYEMLHDLAAELQTVNFILLNYNPDVRESEDLGHLSQFFADYDPGMYFYTVDPASLSSNHPADQFECFIVPECLLISPDNRVTEHFVINTRTSFKYAVKLIAGT